MGKSAKKAAKKKRSTKKNKKNAKKNNLDASADEYETYTAEAAADTKVVRYDRTKGPFFKLDADLATSKFDMEFNAYAIIEGMGEAGIRVKLTETSFEGELVNVKVFGSPLTCDLSAKILG